MAQESWGLPNTPFTVAQWRHIFGAEPGIVGDRDGSAYKLTLPTGSDNAVLGSATQDSTSVVAGALHRIAQGETQTVTIPASTNPSVGRTDLVVVRYDAGTFSTDPGPCRLVRIPGVEGSSSTPSYNQDGVLMDLPLFAITRKQGQSLNQAAVRDWRRRIGPTVLARPLTGLGNAPVGSRVVRDGTVWRKDIAANGSTELVRETWFDGDGVMVAGTVPLARQERARSGWFADYTPETTGTNIRPSSGYFRHYGMNIPVKLFPRMLRIDTYLDLDFQAGNGWRVDVEWAESGSANEPGSGSVIASQVLGVPPGADGMRHHVAITAGAIVSAGDARVVRVWVRRVGGNDGIASYDLAGYAFRAEWVEISAGNDW
ncbi:hypothetical protein IF650_13020 [Cellulosimicrobium terreum]|nr:hypothetical protein [Cellulosimicrobium terreum]